MNSFNKKSWEASIIFIFVVFVMIFITILELYSNNDRQVFSFRYGRNIYSSSPSKYISLKCFGNEAALFSQAFIAHKVYPRHDSSHCPSDSWLEAIAKCDPNRQTVLINIGVNKGYNFANWINVFAKNTKITPLTWYHCLQKAAPEVNYSFIDPWTKETPMCGVCRDCRTQFSRLKFRDTRRNLTLIGVDISPSNIELVKNAIKLMNVSHSLDGITMNLILAGGSDFVGNISIDCGSSIGSEVCALDRGRRLHTIPLLTGDKIISDLRETLGTSSEISVDIMQIDTEGHDPLVLLGLKESLIKKRIKIVIFEYHGKGFWSLYNLSSFVEVFDNFHYDCFFMGQNRLWKLTDCWHLNYEFHEWSNVMCILRSSKCFYSQISRFIVKDSSLL